ncbi:MAG: hypothetical protein ACR2JQ_02615 [Mycobacteriales bacterium]
MTQTEAMTAEPDVPSVALLDLTDEELAVFDGAEDTLVFYPYLSELGEDDRRLAMFVALRGLIARGMVQPPEDDVLARMRASGTMDAKLEVGLNQAVERILQMRSGAFRAVIAQRSFDGADDCCYFYQVNGEIVLEELVESSGLHHFRLLESGVLPDTVARYLNPTGIEGEDGTTERIDAATAAAGDTPPAMLERLGEATSFGEFVVRRLRKAAEHPPMFGVFAGPGGLHLTEAEFGTGEPVPVTPISAATLRARIADCVR